MNKYMRFLMGFLLLVLGLGLVMKNWSALADMIKACAGLLIALIGMVMMFSSGLRK